MAKTILITDDAAIIRLMLTNILTEAGYQVIGEAANGKEAVHKYSELKPDLVIMDITMPEMNGLKAVKAIREIDSNAKIVICSAMGQKTLVLEAIQLGAANYIVKPFEKEKVVEVMRKILG